MSQSEKESIIVVSKFLALCKEDENKLFTMRNYLNHKIQSIMEKRQKNNLQQNLDFRSL
jgi:hypothetical protein